MLTEEEIRDLVGCYIDVEGYDDLRSILSLMSQEYSQKFDRKQAIQIIRETLRANSGEKEMLNWIIPTEGYITIGNFYKNPIRTFGTTIIFDSDEAFEDFCVAPVARIRYSSDGEPVSYGGAYTEMYTKCIKAGMKFLIRDRQSKVYNRKAVTKRVLVPSELGSSRKDVLVQLSVQNLESRSFLSDH